jgi:DNA-binding response OmpR family regulator
MSKVLVVEDDANLAQQIEAWLKHEQHIVEIVDNGQEAADRLKFYHYDCVVLDWGLPKLTGIEVLRQFRGGGGTTPVLMLTGKGEVPDKTMGLDSGADDYLTKPFFLEEFGARIRALLCRQPAFTGNTVKIKNLELDRRAHRVTKDGVELKLLPKEFALLELFMTNPNTVFGPDLLLERVWSSESDSTVDTVYTFIKTLRKKITPEAPTSLIQTVTGVGYKLNDSGQK